MGIPFRIRQIKTLQFAMFPDLLAKGPEVNVRAEFSFGINNEVNDIRCVSKILYEQGEQMLLIIEVHCFFDVSSEGSRQLVEQGRVKVDFLRYLATIATGTVRGIICAKTEGTELSSYVLPPINLVELIKEDFVFKSKDAI